MPRHTSHFTYKIISKYISDHFSDIAGFLFFIGSKGKIEGINACKKSGVMVAENTKIVVFRPGKWKKIRFF